MGRIRARTVSSLWTILLLVLAVSPVTAPFSSCDLGNLFSDRDGPGAILQSKGTHDPSVAGPAGTFVPGVSIAAGPEPFVGIAAPTEFRAVRQFPLRI